MKVQQILIAAMAIAGVVIFTPRITRADIIINFETFPGLDGILGTADDVPAPNSILPNGPVEPLRIQYSSVGITFSSGVLFQGNFFPGTTSGNHFISSSPPDATLSVPVYGISIDSYSFWTATLTAFDASNNVIATNILTNPNEGSAFLFGTLGVSTSQAINRFTVRASNSDLILNLDNLTLRTSIPEPGTCLLLAGGLLPLVGVVLRRRKS